mgnify:FL=1|jgi:hypothetical protein
MEADNLYECPTQEQVARSFQSQSDIELEGSNINILDNIFFSLEAHATGMTIPDKDSPKKPKYN